MHKIEELGLLPERCAMVGDRLYTDIAMANRAGCVGVLVLSGEATMEDVAKLDQDAEQMPTIIVNSVAELLQGVSMSFVGRVSGFQRRKIPSR